MASSHLKALLKKNWILTKRSWCWTICEIVIPAIFVLLFQVFRVASPTEEIAATSYYSKPFTFPDTVPGDGSQLLKACNDVENGGYVALAPEGDSLITQLDTMFTGLGYKTKFFEDDDAIDTYVEADRYGYEIETLCFGITVNKNNIDNKYEYSIRFNVSDIQQDIPDTRNEEKIEPIFPVEIDTLNDYAYSGYLTIQNWVDNLILQQETSSSSTITVEMSSVKVPAYTEDSLLESLVGTCAVIVSYPMFVPFLRLVAGILKEKEKRIKEGMKIMGLNSTAFYLSWIITYSIIFFLNSLLFTIFILSTVLKSANGGVIFFGHLGYSLELLGVGLLITVLFDRVKIGSIAAFVLLFLSGWPYAIVQPPESTPGALLGMSFAPASSIAFFIAQALKLEDKGVGLTSDTTSLEISNYKAGFHYVGSYLMIVILIVLTIYLEQVMPSEFGVKKHPLFCLKRNCKVKPKEHNTQEAVEEAAEDDGFEKVDPALSVQDKQNESIKVKHLRKKYANGKLAVDDVNYNMYKGQIFALLGHNGAGKTSTINMITGLYPASSGTVDVFGLDIHQDLDKIRKNMGVCPQYDVLFDQLTVQEHLELFAVFKGMDTKNFKEEIDHIIKELDLEEKRNYMAKDLSGGQKRKLCVGLAFVGGSQFVLLDEPSSGLDTSARRRLWEMLKNFKPGRVILLTTHYMDEADFLGDRIAIMGQGKIQCLGSSLYLKNMFGVGYSLTIVKESATIPNEPIMDLVKNHIQDAKHDGSQATAELPIKLPTKDAPKFKELFKDIDSNTKKLSIKSYGVSVTTLEEVFLTVADKTHQKVDIPAIQADHSTDNYSLDKERINTVFESFVDQFKALFKKRWQYSKRDIRGLITETLVPTILIIVGIIITLGSLESPGPVLISSNQFNEVNHIPYNTILPDTSAVDTTFFDSFSSSEFKFTGKAVSKIADFDAEMYKIRDDEPFPKVGIFWKELNKGTNTYSYFAEIDTRAQDASPFTINQINNGILKFATGNEDKEIVNYIRPFAKTKSSKAISNTITGFGISFIFSIGMSFFPASVVTYIVRERETNVKHQQKISGMSVAAYWFANFAFEYAKYLVPCILTPLVTYGIGAEAVTADDKYGVLWGLFILYGAAIAPFTYLCAFLFKDSGKAQTATFFINFGTGFIGALTISLLRLIESTRSIAKILHWIFRFSPTFALTYGFLDLTNKELISLTENNFILLDAIDINVAGGDILALGVTCLLYFTIIFIVERLQSMRIGLFEPKTPYDQITEMDGDVEDENAKIENEDPESQAIMVKNMRKVYKLDSGKTKTAVNKVSFAVKKGECFGLLGVNGAGKTTSFKMLTGEIPPTEGEIYIKGHKVPDSIHKARQYIGYCPQFDALLENLTAREHLELYAAIKGIPHKYRESLVQKQLYNMNLKPFENVLAGTYSGGNKRKLSVALALLGNPAVIFLDEPSNGMDPEARRFMWDVISSISTRKTGDENKSSVILTTHSMEEAEYLTSRLAIQVSGNLKCIGSSQHIKNRYGGGFEIEVKLEFPTKEEINHAMNGLKSSIKSFDELKTFLGTQNAAHLFDEVDESKSGAHIYGELKHGQVETALVVQWILIEKAGANLIEFVNKNFKDLVIVEHFQSFYRLKISSDKSIGDVFGFFEDNKKNFKIVQYSVRQTSIEQIFNAFAFGKIQVKPKGNVTMKYEDLSNRSPQIAIKN